MTLTTELLGLKNTLVESLEKRAMRNAKKEKNQIS